MIMVENLPEALVAILKRREPDYELRYATRSPSGDRVMAFYYKDGLFVKNREFSWQ